jgi:hypothetical protein
MIRFAKKRFKKKVIPDTVETVPIWLTGVPERVVTRNICRSYVGPIERGPEQLLGIVAYTGGVNLDSSKDLVPFRSVGKPSEPAFVE